MSIMLQIMLAVLVVASIYASYVHTPEWYHRIFALFPDFKKIFRYENPDFVKIEVVVPYGHAEGIRNTIKMLHPESDPAIVIIPMEQTGDSKHGSAVHGH